jgi:hypothetical protein
VTFKRDLSWKKAGSKEDLRVLKEKTLLKNSCPKNNP